MSANNYEALSPCITAAIVQAQFDMGRLLPQQHAVWLILSVHIWASPACQISCQLSMDRAGLGAAWHLATQGFEVDILEAGEHPGGLVAGWQTKQGRYARHCNCR